MSYAVSGDPHTYQDLAVGGECLAREPVRQPVGPLTVAAAVAHGVARVARAQPHAAAVRRAADAAARADGFGSRLLVSDALPKWLHGPQSQGLPGERKRLRYPRPPYPPSLPRRRAPH